ncbi:UDP-glucosyltransferase 2-like [Anthonomus grandis grandis]|uniref:UDP-glucosyltransferase 2-like n=1 Tax=Anthonomus grandis grandis TaxID=2921223 RepID=UPI0021663845|nr:UDP-glucosyltransferase 2-like [Anthonomus grandis grandis]
MILMITLLVLQSFPEVHPYNILMIAPIDSLSHTRMFEELAKALAVKGHQVDLLSHFPLENLNMEGISHINLGSSNMFLNSFSVKLLGRSFIDIVDKMLFKPGHQQCLLLYNNPQFEKLKNATKKYDLFITEFFTSECVLPWAWHFNIPSVLVSTSLPLPWNNERFGVPDNPSYVPNYYGDFGAEMTLFQRAQNVWQYAVARYKFWRSMNQADQVARAFFGPQMPPLEEVAYNSSLLLSNTHFSIHDARPLPPNVIEIGGLHINPPKPLSKHLDKLLDGNPQGTIYFSIGSMFAAETFPDETLQGILDAFAQLPYDVIWRVNVANLSKNLNFSKNVHLESWVPQLDLLCDPRVKLFFSHGGIMGMQESIYCGVPILNFPIIADQRHNSRHAELMGFGLVLEDISTASILDACGTLLNDSKYAGNAKKASREFLDRPLSAADTATFWIEYVIRNQGAPKMQSYAKRLRWYQYYMLDLLVLVVTSLWALLYLLVLGVRFVLNRRRNQKKIKQN